MNAILKSRFEEFEALTTEAQSRVLARLDDALAQEASETAHDLAMQDPEYRRYVEDALDQAIADGEAGRVYPFKETTDKMFAEFRTEHGI